LHRILQAHPTWVQPSNPLFLHSCWTRPRRHDALVCVCVIEPTRLGSGDCVRQAQLLKEQLTVLAVKPRQPPFVFDDPRHRPKTLRIKDFANPARSPDEDRAHSNRLQRQQVNSGWARSARGRQDLLARESRPSFRPRSCLASSYRTRTS